MLTPAATLSVPPAVIPAAEILPENLPAAWKDDETTALAVATALSHKVGKVLPWKTVRDVITGSLQARFTELVDGVSQVAMRVSTQPNRSASRSPPAAAA